MATTGVGEAKTRFLTDVSTQGLSPSLLEDRREEVSLPSVKSSSADLHLSMKTSGLPNLIEEQTSVLDPAKQYVSVLRETSDPSSVKRLGVQQVSSSGACGNSRTPNERNVNIVFQGSATRENATFAFPTVRPPRKSVSSQATMVAVTAAHRPVLFKSHSVAYGVDSTVASPSTPALPLQQHFVNETMANGDERVPQPSQNQGIVTEVMPPPVTHIPLSTSSPSLSFMTERSSAAHQPHPLGLSRVLGEKDLAHQGSLGFNTPDPWRQPLRRSESVRSDSSLTESGLHSSETTPATGDTRAVRHSRLGGSQRTGKWRSSSLVRRSSSRNQPLLGRSNSRNALLTPSSGAAAQQKTRCQSEGREDQLLSSSAPVAEGLGAFRFGGGQGTFADDLAARNEDLPSDVIEDGEEMSSRHEEVFRPDDIAQASSTRSRTHSHNKNTQNLAGAKQQQSDVFFGDGVVHSNTDEAMQSDIMTKHDDRVEMESADLSQSSHSRPLHRQLSRRRNYQQATADPSSTASCADDDQKRDDDDHGVDPEGDRGVRVEDVSGEEEEGESPSFTPPGSPPAAKSRRVDMSSSDPYQIFEVQHLPCIIFTVKVLHGRNITNGWALDWVDTPDPYIKLRIKTAPEGRQRTITIANNANPVWNETFTFFLGFSENNVLELTLMEENPLIDQETGTIYFNVHERMREFGKWQTELFNFNGVSEVDVAFHMEWDQHPTLRYSLCLSKLEKEFMRKRKQKVRQALNAILGESGPHTLGETPTIAVIGSGGGFRAMTGYSGVFKALADSGILDCATYACGLSGSSWYLSTLYSHEKWPKMNPGDLQQELMTNIDKSLVRLLGPQSLYRYVRSVVGKRRQGQPVSFTDFFGHMVGETLLKGRLECRLTDQREKIEGADVPMPLYTCVHVKKDVPARSFQEWVEFSPYEIGMPKYGTFMDSKYFGSKFYMGKLVKSYQELPLHFLQGIWGSAFCILFKRLLENNRNLDPAEMIRREMELRTDLSHQLQDDDHDSSDISDDEDGDDETDDTDEEAANGISPSRRRSSTSFVPPASLKKSTSPADFSDRDTSDGESSENDPLPPKSFLTRQDSSEGFEDVDGTTPAPPSPASGMEVSSPRPIRRTSSPADVVSGSPDGPKKGVRFSHQVDQLEKRKKQQQQQQQQQQGRKVLKRAPTIRRGKSRSYWSSILRGIFERQNFEVLSTRAGRAAVIHNFMRGLNLQQTYPLSPFTPLSQRVQEGDEFDGIFDLHPTHIKHIYMVDAGLTFNSPYPLVLRPQRGVDIILSFDFSARDSDQTPPFKELLLAEKWAKINRLPFPPIDPGVVDREGLKEVYVFQDRDDPHCPVVLHFPLVNIEFRKFKVPGVPRETKEEKDFADFDIFDDPTAPFSTFNFTYTAQNFQRLSKLTEFNTLHSMDRIKAVFAEVVARKREASPRVPIHTRDFKLLRMKSVQERHELKKFLKKMESRSSIKTPTPTSSQPPTPFFTPGPRHSVQERNPFVFNLHSKSSSSSDSSQEGKHPFFSRQSSQTKSGKDSNKSPRSPRRVSSKGPKSPRKQSSEVEVRRGTSGGASQEFVSTSSFPIPPSPAASTDSYDDVFSHSPSTPTTSSHPAFFRPSSFNERAQISNVRQNSPTSLVPLRQTSGLPRKGSEKEDEEDEEEEFHDAAEAFTRDGEAVTDSQQAKMYYEGPKERRKMFRRQSTISTLNSITESISLDSEDPPSRLSSRTSNSLASSGPLDIADLGQFEGIADDDDDNHNHNDDNEPIDDVDAHWYDGESNEHRGSVIRLDGDGGN